MSSSSRPRTPNSQQRKSSRRHSHRSSGAYLLSQSPKIHYPIDPENLPLESSVNTEKFERLSDSLEELDSNMTDLASIHEAISNGFNESFASFLYGLSITMWCVDYPGCPTRSNWERLQSVKVLDQKIARLTEDIKAAREEHETCKEKLASIERRGRPVVPPRARDVRKTPLRRADAARNRARVAVKSASTTDEDSYVTNEGSFVTNPGAAKSRIPQLEKSQPTNTAKAYGSTAGVTVSSSKNSPNLNQPPRYLRGLFDNGNTNASGPSVLANNASVAGANRARRLNTPSRVTKETTRRPFR